MGDEAGRIWVDHFEDLGEKIQNLIPIAILRGKPIAITVNDCPVIIVVNPWEANVDRVYRKYREDLAAYQEYQRSYPILAKVG